MPVHDTTTSMDSGGETSAFKEGHQTADITETIRPYFHRSPSTRLLCILGLIFSWLCAITCIIVGSLVGGRAWVISLCSPPAENLIVLAQNIIITICNETLGYIHSVSLRWALQEERRLEFNSNLRLLSSPRSRGPNAWYSNLLMTCGIITTYGSSAITFQLVTGGHCRLAYNLLGNAVIVLGCGLAVQACIATWAICYERNWPTWSSNALDVAAACLEPDHQFLWHHPGRSIRDVHALSDPVRPEFPNHRQPFAFRCHSQIRYVLYLLWTASILCCVWFAVLLACTARQLSPVFLRSKFWRLIPPYEPHGPFLPLFDNQGDGDHFSARDFAWLFVLLCTLQSVVTFTLHAAELLINCSRDEDMWRRASRQRGASRTSNALIVLLMSYQSVILFCLKPFAHWVYSLSFMIDIYNGIWFCGPQIVYLAITVLLLTAFATWLAFRRYKGAQPVTFGHLQTLVDLIDVWPERKDRMYWGDKGILRDRDNDTSLRLDNGDLVRRAGTDWHPLPAVKFDRKYI